MATAASKRMGMRIPSHSMAAVLAASLTVTSGLTAHASSHREGPAIAGMPRVDASDFYMFSKRSGFVTLIANYLPLQDAFGGPNYFNLEENALYEIHIDNNGDALEDITFQFRFKNIINDITVPAGPNGSSVSIPLALAGSLTGASGDPINVMQTYTVDMVKGPRRGGVRTSVTSSSGSTFIKPMDYIGDKTFSSANGYDNYAAKYMYSDVKFGDCAATGGRVFVGQRKDPFALPLGRLFDLVNIDATNPGSQVDSLASKNVTSLVLEVPVSCLTQGKEPVIGAWTTASLRQGRILLGAPTSGAAGKSASNVSKEGGPWVQVSRLGMPLVNEVVIGLKDKDRFNASKPTGDAQFATYVTNPTLPYLIEATHPEYKAAIGGQSIVPTGVRDDLVAIFLTGIAGLNKPLTVTPSEMLRLNTTITSRFPNGRNPQDDVVDMALQAMMGAYCMGNLGELSPIGATCKAALPTSITTTLGDGVPVPACWSSFPYLTTPVSGSK